MPWSKVFKVGPCFIGIILAHEHVGDTAYIPDSFTLFH